MRPLSSAEIRRKFLDFFDKHGHKIMPSSSLVPDDPTMLLTGAGMVQFKPIFLGEKKVDFNRAASVQKCGRTTDIERVGLTARHLTFFEMLGNFSFGDYYKKDAILWAWDFVTNDFGLPPEAISATIYKDDEEAYEIWRNHVELPDERIFRMEDDNFWSAGPTGPCGPSSELIYDRGEEYSCGPDCRVGCDCDRFLELWNLVFMQYDRDEEGNLHPLPRRNIDTGMGLERAALLLQGGQTVFDTDVLKPIVDRAAKLAKVKYGTQESNDISLRIVADHVRTVTFLIGDGVLPSNEARGYVLRRLIRRAVRHGRLLGITKPFLAELCSVVVETMGGAYPDLTANQDFIIRIASHEEERFLTTLKQGLAILSEMVNETKAAGGTGLSGEVVFRLYDTYGFPLELTREIAQETGLGIDENGFQELMEEQRERARAAWAAPRLGFAAEIYTDVLEEFGKTDFVGYERDQSDANLLAIIKGQVVVPEAAEGDIVEIVLDRTPFYAEKGGQVGDVGVIKSDAADIQVNDTQEPVTDLYVHKGKVLRGTVRIEDRVVAEIDAPRRRAIERSHTATHILQWALRLVLGEHVKQAGSVVEPDRFRFDFTHFSGMSAEELKKVERLVNDKVFENQPVRAFVTSLEYAKEVGAMALFDQKYGDFVRLVEIGNFSRELCGGTHAGRTSEIALFKITSEGSVAANTRRIEAITAERALNHLEEEQTLLREASGLLKADPKQVVEKIRALQETIKKQEQQLASLRSTTLSDRIEQLISQAKQLDGARVIVEQIDATDAENLRFYVDVLRGRLKSAIVLLASVAQDRVTLVAGATADLVAAGFNAGDLLKKVAPFVGGGGGGRPDMAQAGGKEPAGVGEALGAAWKHIETTLKGS